MYADRGNAGVCDMEPTKRRNYEKCKSKNRIRARKRSKIVWINAFFPPKCADYVAFGDTFITESATLLPMLRETDLGLNEPNFKIAKAVQCCVVWPHAAVFDFAHTLPAKANVAAQIRLC
jgi:hypothetical protein